MERTHRANWMACIFAAALLLAALGFLVASIVLTVQGDGTVNGGTVPLVVSSLLAAACVWNFIVTMRQKSAEPSAPLGSVLWMLVALLGVVAALLLHVPFYLVCPVFLFVSCFFILHSSWWASLLTAAVTTGLSYLVFALLLRVPLP